MLKETVKFRPPPHKKGLVIKCSFDGEWGGIYCKWSKHRFEICLGFMAFRVFFMSEARYDFLMTFISLNRYCVSHDFVKNSRGE